MESITRVRINITGTVQGVGFRPFIYRLARELDLNGWIENSNQGVIIEAEAGNEMLQRFLYRIQNELPDHAHIQNIESSYLDFKGYNSFTIRESATGGAKTALVLPDIATCPQCLDEIFDGANRRHLYPFTNCTHCGPRFSIITGLPYDRDRTTMTSFSMCQVCEAEYRRPDDRRYHAQPNACPDCGPQLAFWDREGRPEAERHDALMQAVAALHDGQIVAVKGLGGVHLMVDAGNQQAVAELRKRKLRGDKPFALMFPDPDSVIGSCRMNSTERQALLSPAAPIVLLEQSSSAYSHAAPGNPCLGVMLPYTPMHHIMLREFAAPLIATSGNLSDEPICIDEFEALQRLAAIADCFLVHNRPINRHVDDSVVRVMLDREMVLRRARGFAPLPISCNSAGQNILAVGAHLKNTIALSVTDNIFISQHIGDLETVEAGQAFENVIDSFQTFYQIQPEIVACDMHPDYISTQFAENTGRQIVRVQHHYAHVLSCMLENEIDAPVLGVSWDGTGYGDDGTIWGGEFFIVNETSFRRIAHLRTFKLPGGDKAVMEPGRVAISMLNQIYGQLDAFPDLAPLRELDTGSLRVILDMINKDINTAVSSSAGRLFDAVAAIIGLRWSVDYEGQAAMELEFAIGDYLTDDAYEIDIIGQTEQESQLLDWQPMIDAIVQDVRAGMPAAVMAAKFHNALAQAIVNVAEISGEECVVLSGGCFQNRYLTERAVADLRQAGFKPYWHQRIPPNDGGIAVGQVAAANRHFLLQNSKTDEPESS